MFSGPVEGEVLLLLSSLFLSQGVVVQGKL